MLESDVKKTLVAGGAGFIGSHLCDFLLEIGYRVICLDSLITGTIENIRHNMKNEKFVFIKHDISEPIKIAEKLNWVINLASPASPADYLKHPIETLKTGAFGTYYTLNLALDRNAKYLLASTSEIYGDPEVSPQAENYWGNVNPIGIRSCYDEAKRFAEAMVMSYHRVYGLDTKVARIFNTYGPRMRINDGRVVPNFIYQALTGKPMTIYGKGKQTRSLCYISDLINGLYKLMCSSFSGPANLGNPNELSVLELARITKMKINSKSKFIYMPLPQDDPKGRKPDITIAKVKLKWRPTVSLEEGLDKTIEYFKRNVEVKVS